MVPFRRTGQAGLADRRLQEAAIYLDDSTRAAEDEFAYLIINMESGASYETDFAVYEIGKTYGSFPKAEKLGYSFAGFPDERRQDPSRKTAS